MKKVVIIGGGIAGLAAGVLLSKSGHEVSIFESKNHPGGRAYSFTDKNSGMTLDNGQHILMGCYQYTLKFLKEIKSYDRLDIQKNLCLKYRDTENNSFTFECNSLPAPLHLLSGLIKLPFVSMKDIYGFFRLGTMIYHNMIFKYITNESAHDLLVKSGQREIIMENLWKPIIISVFNAKPESVSGKLFLNTMHELFFKKSFYSNIILPNAGLSKLFSEPAKESIISNNGNIFTGKRAVKFNILNKRTQSVAFSDGTIQEGDLFISAMPYFELLKFPELAGIIDSANIKKMSSSPIIGIYILLNKPILTDKILFLLKTKIQVLFNKSKICNLDNNGQLLSLVISCADDFVRIDKEKLKETIIGELSIAVPDFSPDKVMYFKVIKERKATLLIDTFTNNIRPNIKTKSENLFLAGDWINTGLPATIESAVKSAYMLMELLKAFNFE